jgi:molybdate transport system ATP-binding protein
VTGLAVHAAVAGRDVDLALDVPSGSVVAVVGPNGSGKTTLLHLVAGLVAPTSGTVRIGERTVAETATGSAAVTVPPHRRHVALLTQRPALFPHLDVLANVMFGPLATGSSRAVAKERAQAELAAVGCAEFASRRAHQLSGGQAQRVAIARALAADPEVVLLDEPLAGLDIAVAAEVRHALAGRLRGRTALLVTHEVLDIWTIADRVAVVEAGRVVASGATADLLARPPTGFLAQLGGTNLLSGIAVGTDSLELAPGVLLRGLADADQPPSPGTEALASVPPEAVSLHLAEPGGSPRNVLAAEVTGIEPRGQVVRVHLALAGHDLSADLTAQAVAELALRPGSPVRAAIKATSVRLYGR